MTYTREAFRAFLQTGLGKRFLLRLANAERSRAHGASARGR
jgi:hypothetical protein